MAGRAAAELDLDPSEREVGLVVDDDDVAGRRPVLAGELHGALPLRFMNVCGRAVTTS